MAFLPVMPLAVLLAGVILQVILGRVLPPRAKGWLAFLCGLGALAALLGLIPATTSGTPIDLAPFALDPSLTLQFHVDGLGLLFALMAAGIGTAILLYCVDYMTHEPSGTTRFYALMLTFIAGLVTLVFSANLLLAYLSWEVIGLCSYFLVGFWYREQAAANGARKVLLMTHIPGYAFLAGILLLYTRSGTLLWTDPALTAQFTTGIFLLMLVAAMAKSVMFPLHTWIPEAMNAPTPVSALLHSACYVKAGIYLIARMYSFNAGAPWAASWSALVIAIGCVTMLVGAIFALSQTDLKRLLAYSTISQLGYIVAALGMGTPAGLYAALFYTFGHGLFKGTLFLCAGAVQHAAGTRDMRRLGGLAARMPHTARIWLVAAAAIIGVPLTNGFIAKWILFDTAVQQGQWVVVVVAWLVSILTAFYMLKATVSIFYGELPLELRDAPIQEAPMLMRLGMAILAGLCLLFGIFPQILSRWIVAPAAASAFIALNARAGSELIQNLQQPLSLTGVLVMIAALLIGGLIWAAGRAGAKAVRTVSTFTGGDPLPQVNQAGADDFSDLAQAAFTPVTTITDPDPLYALLWWAIRALADLVRRGFARLEDHALIAVAVLAAVVLAAVWLV